jgi:hypothetical protein
VRDCHQKAEEPQANLRELDDLGIEHVLDTPVCGLLAKDEWLLCCWRLCMKKLALLLLQTLQEEEAV